MQSKQLLADAARRGSTSDRHARLRDMWPTHAGPNVLAWSYRDPDPECHTVYTVFVAHPGGKPRLQLAFEDGTYTQVPITAPERFGAWDTPRAFSQWARAWYEEGSR